MLSIQRFSLKGLTEFRKFCQVSQEFGNLYTVYFEIFPSYRLYIGGAWSNSKSRDEKIYIFALE